MNTHSNPLQQFYRQEKLYISLPSNGSFYEPGVVELNSNNEIGIRAMTAADELLLKNPDALLNGEAIRRIILSCVPSVKKPDKLLANDVEAIVVAIRHASFGDKLEVSTKCPNCNTESIVELSISDTLNTAQHLEDHYKVDLENGVHLFLRPFTFVESMQSIKSTFEQNNIIRQIEDDRLSEEEKLKIVGTSIAKLGALTLEMVANSIIKAEIHNGDEVITVTNATHIKEFMSNIGRDQGERVQEILEKINKIGIKQEYTTKCNNCGHEYEIPIDFNPATFFTKSL